MIRTLTVTALLAWSGPGWTLHATGQERIQPASIDSLVARFHADPGGTVPRLIGACPRSGTWQPELLERLLEVPTASPGGSTLVNSEAWNVQHCSIPALDAWFRAAMLEPYSRHNLYTITGALWNSEDDANRRSVLRTAFDENIDWRSREIIAEQLGSSPHGEGSVRYLHIMADGFREFGTPPPPTTTMHHLLRAGSTGPGLLAKRALLSAWRDRSDGPGSLVLLNTLVGDALTDIETDAPPTWRNEVGELLEDILAGRQPAPPEVLEFVQARIRPFRPGRDR